MSILLNEGLKKAASGVFLLIVMRDLLDGHLVRKMTLFGVKKQKSPGKCFEKGHLVKNYKDYP